MDRVRASHLFVVSALIAVLAVGAVVLVPGMAAAQGDFAGGDGTENEPYEITNWTHLNNTRDDLGANYTLVNDLNESTDGYGGVASETANGGDGFEPIGDNFANFAGSFNGSGHTISNLTIDRSESWVGLFGYTNSASIEKVGLEDVDIRGTDRVGGLIGDNRGTVSESYVTGTVTGANGIVGGLVGENTRGVISESYTTSAVDGADEVGGLVGSNFDGTVKDSYAAGTVTGDADVGGLVGFNELDGIVNDSYATGTVTGNEQKVGGLVGYNYGSKINDSYATGGVDGDNEVGGLVGLTEDRTSTSSFSTVNKAYALGNVNGSSAVGGFVGSNAGGATNITDAYWDNQAATITNSSGEQDDQGIGNGGGDVTGLTTRQMTGTDALGSGNMDGFDADVWSANPVVETNGYAFQYPTLDANTQIPPPSVRLYAGGDGGGNPYEIETWEQLNNTRENLAVNFTLINDLNESTDGYNSVVNETANDGKGFIPIGDDPNGDRDQIQFNGTFDGSNNTISNLSINRSDESYVGLFGSMYEDALIENIGLEDVEIHGDGDVGGLVGYNGEQGNNDATIKNSSVTGNVTGGDESNIGGLIGTNRGTIENSTANATVNSSRSRIGGLVGRNFGGTVSGSYATGAVDGNGNVGGLVGYNQDTIKESYATGTINGSSSVGGLVGWNNGITVENTSATGAVTGDEEVGGLVGKNDDEVIHSYAVGEVDGNDKVGGLIGYRNSGSTTDSYWDTDRTGQDNSDGGTGLRTVEMIGSDAPDNMEGFDFAGTWMTVTESTTGADGDGYPVLSALDTSAQVLVPTVPDTDNGGSGTNDGSGSSGGSGGGDASDEDGDSDETDDDEIGQDPRTTVDQSEPDVDISRAIEDSDPDTSGSTVDTSDETDFVESITFVDEKITGSLSVREYGNERVITSVTSSLSAQLDRDVRSYKTIADISVRDSADNPAPDTPSTVRLRMDSEDITEPDNVVIHHETDDGWEQLETTVDEIGENRIRVSADVDGFSMFAVTELGQEDKKEEVDDEPDEPAETENGIPGFGVIVAIVAFVGIIAIARIRG